MGDTLGSVSIDVSGMSSCTVDVLAPVAGVPERTHAARHLTHTLRTA